MATTINADDGVISGSAGLKTEADASGELALQSNGTTAVTVTTGRLVIRGYTSNIPADDAGGSNRTTWGFQTHSTAVSGAGYLATYWADNEFGPGGLTVGKSRGASIGTRAIVQNGDELGQIGFVGDDGTNFISAAGIFAVVDGTPGTNDMPGKLLFKTTADGASAPTTRMQIDSAGTITLASGSGLSIARTAVTAPATTDGNVFSGTYTPTLTNTTNIAASTAFASQYMRVGNVVTVSGRVTIDPTATGSITLGVSLPIASTFTANQQCCGTSANAFGDAIQVIADSTNLRATFTGTVADAGARLYAYNFTYQVL